MNTCNKRVNYLIYRRKKRPAALYLTVKIEDRKEEECIVEKHAGILTSITSTMFCPIGSLQAPDRRRGLSLVWLVECGSVGRHRFPARNKMKAACEDEENRCREEKPDITGLLSFFQKSILTFS